MIQLTEVSFRYRTGTGPPLLNRLELRVGAGEYVLICGPSGSGKSTLACLLIGLIPHLIPGELSGSVKVAGICPSSVPVADFLDRVGLVLQNAEAQLFNSRVDRELAYGLESLGRPGAEIDRRVREIARRLEIEPLLDRFPETLSGGEQRLVALASVLITDPPILVLDEPFAHLDQVHADRLRRRLRQLHRAGKTIVLIEQRLEAVLADVDRCVILDEGAVVGDGRPGDLEPVLRQRHLIPRYPEPWRRPNSGCEAVLETQGLSCLQGRRPVIRDFSLRLCPGRVSALVGAVGSGKTTLIRTLIGLHPAHRGTILLDGRPFAGSTPEQRARVIGVAFQNPNDHFFTCCLADELAAGPRALDRLDPSWLKALEQRMGLGELSEQSPYRLSEGQKKRLSLAIALASKPRVLILDEPTVGQDGRSLEQLAGLVRESADQGLAVLIATHDRSFARAVADEAIALPDWRSLAPAPQTTAFGGLE